MPNPLQAEAQLQNLMENLRCQVCKLHEAAEREQLTPFLQEAQRRWRMHLQNKVACSVADESTMSQFESELERRFKQLEQEFRPWAADMGERFVPSNNGAKALASG